MARAVVEPNPVVEPIPVVDPNPCNSNCGYYLSTVIPIPIPAKNGIITALPCIVNANIANTMHIKHFIVSKFFSQTYPEDLKASDLEE